MPAPANVPEPSPELLHEARTLRINVKMLAATLAQARLAGLTETATLPGVPRRFGLGSRICCQADIEQDWLRHWCRALGTSPRYHRKLWEDCFVPQALWEAGMLEPGRRGLGFAVGTEDLPAFFVGRGIEVLATDLDASDDRADAWRDSGQHANRAQNLYRPRLAKAAECDRLLGFRAVDMTAIPEDLLQGRFDFVWSICALEHLGSLEAGEDFIRSAMRCLRPGGTAVHTTEYNMDQDRPTLATGPTVLYQRRHLDRLARALAADGHAMRPLQDPPGGQHLFDQLVDVPPYPHEGGPQDAPHLRLTLGGYTTTSVGLIIQAGAA
ncbi:class I SAM-dependent methyltransferase [Dankookia rubra]|uniref:Class I SAM-dependent methyltransferase n=2 Tax=Dankookia rubra TaxID=1442381 RepID=A0A4R5QMH7_9PROT|nr:class I SAM-dependent methyltransferase [Dankookia rubra]